MKIVILGLSRFGLQFAGLVLADGHQVALIDRNPASFNRLPAGFAATRVLGSGIDEDVMRKAGVDRADLFLAATDSDNTNLMAAQVAKVVFNIKRSIARVHDQNHTNTFTALGMIEVTCPTFSAAQALEQSLAKA